MNIVQKYFDKLSNPVLCHVEVTSIFKCEMCEFTAFSCFDVGKHLEIIHKDSSVIKPLVGGARGTGVSGGETPQSDRKISDITSNVNVMNKDNAFKEFRRLLTDLVDIVSADAKYELIRNFFVKGCDNTTFQGDLHLWAKHFLPGITKRSYHLENKHLIEIFSRIFHVRETEMLKCSKQTDLASTVTHFFKHSNIVEPAKKATLSIEDVDIFLDSLNLLHDIETQIMSFTSITIKCTLNDLKMIIRLITRNFRIQNRIKFILDTVRNLESSSILQTNDYDCKICHFCPIYKD